MEFKNFLFLLLIFSLKSYGQNKIQRFPDTGFKIECECELYSNNLFLNMAKENGLNNILAAYICAKDQNDPSIGAVYNINITDERKSYETISTSNYSLLEKKIVDAYAKNLRAAGFTFSYTKFQNTNALEYTFSQNELPTKAIYFVKNKRTYLIQIGTRNSLISKFEALKKSFVLL